jgi:oligoendopeptidase F
MKLLPFENLPVHTPRRFVPAEIDLGAWQQIEPLYDRLDARAPLCASVADFERWIIDAGELAAALDEESSRRYIAMTCQTDNPDAETAYLRFVEQIEPQLKPRRFRLDEIYLAHPLRAQLPRPRYAVFDRDTQLRVELYRPENIALETRETKLGQEYHKLCGSLTVQFRGEEQTLTRMGRHLEETDRALRQEAWEMITNRRLQEAEKFEEIFEEMLSLRQQMAHNAGFANYLDYAFQRLGRFDYTPADCVKFHDAIESEFMPLLRELQGQRREKLGVEALRPWDLAVDPLNRPPLRPFEQAGQLVANTQRIFDQIDDRLAGGFRAMRDLNLLDLANRKGKAPGGYQTTLAESRLPFIFMNAVGQQRDVETLLHEGGHAFHALAVQGEEMFAYRTAPCEFCEIASMSMELLGNEFIESFYEPPEAQRARRTHLEGIIGMFPWIATVDAFQHWIYSHPSHNRAARRAAWLALMDRFGGDVDWSGRAVVRASLWHRQLHIFVVPFYYVEYGIAQLGALQLWANSKVDKAKALWDYRSALALGGSRPLPELFSAAGCRFDFTTATVKPLVEFVREELARLE